jgi:hypothetical protein
MLVYGIRCPPQILSQLPPVAADYYLDWQLLTFPAYTRPTLLDARGHLSSRFWSEVQRTLEQSTRIHDVDLEHPYITDDEDLAVRVILGKLPLTGLAWYYVPRTC